MRKDEPCQYKNGPHFGSYFKSDKLELVLCENHKEAFDIYFKVKEPIDWTPYNA